MPRETRGAILAWEPPHRLVIAWQIYPHPFDSTGGWGSLLDLYAAEAAK